MPVRGVSPAFVAYVLAFGLTAVGCAVALRRAVQIDDADVRRGLAGLLVGSGGWAALELGLLVAPTPDLKYASYLASLVVGLTTVGAWLYFCSAYTGRSFHRDATYRRVAVGVYLGIVAVKLTNPVHGLYFETTFVTDPFPHLTVRHGLVHWLVTGLSYALAAVGVFMLYEQFLESDYDTRPLGAAVAVTAAPVALDVVGFASTRLLDINYEPLGVAVFAVSALYVFEDRFVAVRLTEGVDDPAVYLDADDRVRGFNRQARRRFPALSASRGEPFAEVLPDAASRLDADHPVVERDGPDGTRYYLLTATPFTLQQSAIGRVVVFTDVTERERQRRELRRQNDQLEDLAAGLRHQLLNKLQVVTGRIRLADDRLDDPPEPVGESLATAAETADRVGRLVDEFATLARYGRTVETTRSVAFGATVRAAFDAVETGETTLAVRRDGEVEADPERLRELVAQAVEFLVDRGATRVTATVDEDGIALTGVGASVRVQNPENLFAHDAEAMAAETRMRLPNVDLLARVHGWTTSVDADDDRVRVEVGEVTARPREAARA